MRGTLGVILALLVLPIPAGAQQPTATGAFLFSYEPHDGRRSEFEAGYRRHLEWHRAKNDTLKWIGWDVIAGPGIGRFVDGIFGVSFSVLDSRVDAAGDARDAAANVDPHATAVRREMLRLRADLSTGTPLETAEPEPLVQVVTYTAPPAERGELEIALRTLRESHEHGTTLSYTIYEMLAGSESSGFVMMIWRQSWRTFDRADTDPIRLLQHELIDLGAGPAARIRLASNEIWKYRADLTYLPAESGSR